MTAPKYHITGLDERISLFARALSLPIRVLIIRILILEGDWVDRDVFTRLDFSSVSRDNHFEALKNLGIVDSRYYNRKIYYSINKEIFEKMSDQFKDLLTLYEINQLNNDKS